MNALEANVDPDFVSVRTTEGQASFQRLSPTDAILNVEYRVSDLEAPLAGGDLEGAVSALCVNEISRMRVAMTGLGEGLAARLDEEGIMPSVTRRWRHRDERVWSSRGGVVRVIGSLTQLHDRIRTTAEVSEAALVREYVRLMIEQREGNIRNIYRQVLQDASRSPGAGY